VTRRLALLAALLACTPAAAIAQQGAEPHLFLSIDGGVSIGGDVWTINRQPLHVVYSTPPVYDTLMLSRRHGSAITLGGSAAYFPSGHLGIGVDIRFTGATNEDHCTPIFLNPDPGRDATSQMCDYLNGHSTAATVISFDVSGYYRFLPRGPVSPYATLGLGLATRDNSTVEVVSDFFDPGQGQTFERTIIADPNRQGVAAEFTGAVGVLVPLFPGYQMHFELRDDVMPIQVPSGAADAITQIAPKTSRWVHRPALTVGLDIVLAQQRRRRY